MFDIDMKSAYKDEVFQVYHNRQLLEVHNKSKNNWQCVDTKKLIPKSESVLIDYANPFKNFTGTVKSCDLLDKAMFIAQDSDGEVYVFEGFPEIGIYIWYSDDVCYQIKSFEENQNWKQAITTVEAIKRFEALTTTEDNQPTPEPLKHDLNAFKVGDVVRVVRKVEEAEGWFNSWIEEMDERINACATVSSVRLSGVYFKEFAFGYPSCALELVQENPNKREESVQVDGKNSKTPQDREDVVDVPDPHIEAIRELLKTRSEVGISKYGTTLARKDLKPSEWAQHLLEELLDAAGYIHRLKCDLETIESLGK